MRLTAGIKGSKNLERWINDQINASSEMAFLESIGQEGMLALQLATPKGSTGETAAGWRYKVTKNGSSVSVRWYNVGHPELTINLATALQYGHGTRNGGWVPGRDYINPALKPVFNKVTQYYMKKGD